MSASDEAYLTRSQPGSVSAENVSARPATHSPLAPRERTALWAHLLRRQLGRSLRLVDLEEGGRAVRVESFSGGDAERGGSAEASGSRTRYEHLPGYSRHEPRLDVIHRGLGRALRLGRFCVNGEALQVDGFRLKDLTQWANFSTPSLADNLGSISSYCNCDCEFCYERGSRRAGLAVARGQLSLHEADTRVRYYSVERSTGLPLSVRFYLEPFANPHCLEILEQLRRATPTEFIELTTNGSHLTEEAVKRLSRLRPIGVTVSLNAATVEWRRRGMHDRHARGAETALASPALLREYDIPFRGSYVPWPSRPLSDLEEAVHLLNRYDAVMARVNLPSWTRFAAQEPPFDTEAYWGEILALVARLRQEVRVPIHVVPAMYQLRTMRPVVEGVISDSPAARAGIRHGDLIVAVEGEPVFTRPEVAKWVAARRADPAMRSTRFALLRAGEHVEADVLHPADRTSFTYPYRHLAEPGVRSRWAGVLGFFLPDGLELSSFVRLKEIVEEHAGRCVLFFISGLAEPHFADGMAMLGEDGAFVNRAELYVEVLPPHHWGGNVMIGDLWTVQDLIEHTAAWIQRQGVCPDVVVVPTTFLSPGGRDLVGRCYLEFERALDIELRLLPCRMIDF